MKNASLIWYISFASHYRRSTSCLPYAVPPSLIRNIMTQCPLKWTKSQILVFTEWLPYREYWTWPKYKETYFLTILKTVCEPVPPYFSDEKVNILPWSPSLSLKTNCNKPNQTKVKISLFPSFINSSKHVQWGAWWRFVFYIGFIHSVSSIFPSLCRAD